VLARAVDLARFVPGCFDVTIEPLVELWRTARESLTQPLACDIEYALSLVNVHDLMLNPWEMTAGLRNIGQAIDLGGIGKGYAGDKIREIFKDYGISSAYSNLGGNVITVGTKPDGSPWQVGIQHPRQEEKLLGAVAVVDQTVVTSGDYQRYYTDNQGKRCHHILDPRTGYPADSGLISVSIVTEKSLTADVLSTALFVAGLEKSLDFLGDFPDTEAIFVDAEMQVFITPGLRHCFQAGEDIDITILDR
jgi:thiamine biosynthesis lipoprotein